MAAFLYEFEWDPAKASANFTKHGVDFERAAEVFRDPLALSIPDDVHSVTEARWITMGKETHGQYVLVVHTFEALGDHLDAFESFRRGGRRGLKCVNTRNSNEG